MSINVFSTCRCVWAFLRVTKVPKGYSTWIYLFKTKKREREILSGLWPKQMIKLIPSTLMCITQAMVTSLHFWTLTVVGWTPPQQVFHIFLAVLERASLKRIFSSWNVSGLLRYVGFFFKPYSLCQVTVYFLAAILSDPLIIHTVYDILYRCLSKKRTFSIRFVSFVLLENKWRMLHPYCCKPQAGHDSVLVSYMPE